METKLCSRCKTVQNLEQFRPRKDRNNRPHSWCDTCRKHVLQAVTQNRKTKRVTVDDYKREKGCCVCGFNESIALDFHHLDPLIKDQTIAAMFERHASLEEIFKEIQKCVVICSNHHRMLHAGLLKL